MNIRPSASALDFKVKMVYVQEYYGDQISYAFLNKPTSSSIAHRQVILEMLTGQPVVDDDRDPSHITLYVEELIDDLKTAEIFDSSAGSWAGVSHLLLDVSTDCLKYKYKKRPPIAQVGWKS